LEDVERPHDLLGRVAIEAHFANVTLSGLISKLLMSALSNNGVAR